MLITDANDLMRRAKEDSGKSWSEVQKALGRGRCNIVSLAHRGRAMVKSYVDILEALGYDVGIYLMKKVD